MKNSHPIFLAFGFACLSALAPVQAQTSHSAKSNIFSLDLREHSQSLLVIRQPVGRTVMVSSGATFSVEASGAPPLRYQWQVSTDGGLSWQDISSATSVNYTVASASLAMNGFRYRCVVSNASGSVTSNAAVLGVSSLTPGDSISARLAVGAEAEINLASLGGVVTSIRGLPRGLRFDRSTQMITGVPSAAHRSGGPYLVGVQVVQPDGSRVNETLSFDVEAFPSWVASSYQGYIVVPEPANAADIVGRGGMFDLRINTGGVYSGRFRMGSRQFPVRGQLAGFVGQSLPDSVITTTAVISPVRNDPSQALAVELRFSANENGAGFVTGQVLAVARPLASGIEINGWQNPWHNRNNPAWGGANRIQVNAVFDAVTGPGAGADFPAGNGFAVITLQSNGTAMVQATLADGVKFGGRAIVSSGGDLFAYQNLHSNHGAALLVMRANTVNGSAIQLDGELDWVKFPTTRTNSYPNGFDLRTTALGRSFVPPARGQGLFGGTGLAAQPLVVKLAGLDISLDSAFVPYSHTASDSVLLPAQLDAGNRIEFAADVPGRPRASLNVRSGLIKGSMRHARQLAGGALVNLNTQFEGIYLPDEGGGPGSLRGFFVQPVTTQTGLTRQFQMGGLVIEDNPHFPAVRSDHWLLQQPSP